VNLRESEGCHTWEGSLGCASLASRSESGKAHLAWEVQRGAGGRPWLDPSKPSPSRLHRPARWTMQGQGTTSVNTEAAEMSTLAFSTWADTTMRPRPDSSTGPMVRR
jgi:hypothetical protein